MGLAYQPAQGLYIDSLTESNHADLVKAFTKAGKPVALPAIGSSVIFVCPNRCAVSASLIIPTTFNASNATDLVIAQTTLHETIHGYLRTPQTRYDTAWGKILEESLCNSLSVRNFTDRESTSSLNDLLADEPLEYRSYIYWNREDESDISILEEWKIFNILKSNRGSYHDLMFSRMLKKPA